MTKWAASFAHEKIAPDDYMVGQLVGRVIDLE